MPTTLPQSLVEVVCFPMVTHGDASNITDLAALFVKVLPSKFDQAVTQLELEPAGVGLTPGKQYRSIEDAISCVRQAGERVRRACAPVCLCESRHPSPVSSGRYV